MLKQIFGFVVLYLAWGVLVGIVAFAVVASGSSQLQNSSVASIQYFCLCVGLGAALGLVGGFSADLRIQNSRQRESSLSNGWMRLGVCVLIFVFYWVVTPSVQ